MKVFHISPENFLADGGVRVEGDTGKICEIFSSEFGISSHICRSKGKGGTKKNSYKFSSIWLSHLYWKEKGRLRTSFRRNSSISHVMDQMS